MSARLVPALMAMATAVLAAGAALTGLWAWVAVAAIVVGLWLAGLWRGWGWSAGAGFAIYTAAAAMGLLQGVGVGWLLSGLALALAAWDLDAFSRQLRNVGRVEGRQALERRHLLRLLAVEAGGLCLAVVALRARLDLGFGLLLLLGLLAIVGLSRAIAVMSEEG